MDAFFSAIGIVGAVFNVAIYWMLTTQRVESNSFKFYAVNGGASFAIAVSIAAHYDSADIGGILVELAWVGVSLLGLRNLYKARKAIS